jgi:hypothetical protein
MTATPSPHWILTIIAGLTAAVAGVPLAALAFAAPGHGNIRVPQRWWLGAPAPNWAIIAIPALTATTATLACTHRTPAVAPAYWTTAVLGVGLAIIDVRHQRLPHKATNAIWVVSGSCLTVQAALTDSPNRLATAVLTAAATGGALLLIAIAFPGQIGLGDVNLASALALTLGWLHWPAALLGLLIGFTVQAIITLVRHAISEHPQGTRSTIPMGQSLVVGWTLVSFMINA